MGGFLDTIANFNPSGFALGNQQREATIANTQADTGLRQQQTADAALENQLKQRALRDQDLLTQAYGSVDWSKPTADRDVEQYLMKNLASANAIMGHRTQLLTLRKNAADIAKLDAETGGKNLENERNLNTMAGNALQPYHDLVSNPDTPPEQLAQAWGPVWHQLNSLEPDKFPPGMPPPNAQQTAGMLGALGLHEQILTDAEKKANTLKAQQETKTSAANQAETEAKLPGTQAEAQIKQTQAAAMQQGGANDTGLVDQMFPPDTHGKENAALKAELRALRATGASPSEIGQAFGRAAAQQYDIAKETNPDVMKARTDQAVATERAVAPFRRENAIAEAKALREGDNPALSGVPPAAAASAVTQATKLDSDYIKAKEAVESMGKLLDLADQSNVAAGANIPMVGVGAANAINGIKRINSAEIAQYGSAGSLLQKIQGKLQGWTEGQPIPASVRDDIRELHQQLGESAYQSYTRGLDSLNKRTGAKFGPTQEAPNIRKSIPTVSTQAQFDALPKGAFFMEDGKKYRKP